MAGFPKEGLYIVLALGCGIVGYAAQRHFVEGEINEYKGQLTNKRKLVSLKQRISPGQVLAKGLCESTEVPAQFAHPRAVLWDDLSRVEGNAVKSPVEKGEVLLWNAMDMGASASVNEKISEGEKALTLAVNSVTGAGGLLRPNMRVDLYGIFPLDAVAYQAVFGVTIATAEAGEASKKELIATRVLDNVTVVAVGTEAGLDYGALGGGAADKSAYNSVTVLVRESQVEKVLLAAELAKASGNGLYCVLRSEMEPRAEGAAGARVISTRQFLEGLQLRKP